MKPITVQSEPSTLTQVGKAISGSSLVLAGMFNSRGGLKVILAIILALSAAASSCAETPKLAVFDTIQSDAIGQKLQGVMIWTGASVNKSGVAVAFRRTFDLPVDPKTAALHIFADARYVLWVNGEYVERGPNRFQPNGPEYDTVNVAAHLKRGQNAIAVLVVGNLSGGKIMQHAPGLTALCEIDGKELFHTDANWKFSDATRFRQVEASWANLGDTQVDARLEDGDWTRAEYSDATWKPTMTVDGKLWGALTARRIPLLREQDVPVHFANDAKLPMKFAAGQKLEFTTGRIVQAYPVVELDAEAGSELSIEPFGLHYIAKGGQQKHFTIDTRGVTGGAITVKSGQATITGFRLVERLYPFDCVGSFLCNDPFLNDLWQLCARSCQVLSEDAYVDCADRERVEWNDNNTPGYDITRTAMAGPAGVDGKPVFSDPRLLEELVRRTGLTLQPEGWVKAHTCSDRYDIHAKIEDRACEWVAQIRMYYEATGDTKVIKEIWPAVVAQMDYFLKRRGDQGLVSTRDWVVWGNPLGYLTGQTTTLNVFVQRALADSAFLGDVIGEKADSSRFVTEADQLAKLINTVLWDEHSGSYFSGYFSDKEVAGNVNVQRHGPVADLPRTNGRTPSTLHANVFALDRGVVPPDRRERVLAAMLKQTLPHPSDMVMVYYYVMKQFYVLDRPELDTRVLDIFRHGWKNMVKSPWMCSWEDLRGEWSHAHIYGMYPGYFLSAYVLGVRRDAPVAERKLIIEPHLGDLTNAKGKVVTEFGIVSVSWQRQNDELSFKFEVPKNVQATLRLPDGDANTLTLDGQKPKVEIQGRHLVLTVGPGAHEGKISVKPLPPFERVFEVKETRMPSDSKDVELFSKITGDSPTGFEGDIVKTGLVRIASTSEEKVASDSVGKDVGALFNGTTMNGSDGWNTLNDGKTYRGYSAGSSLTIRLERPSDITGIRTFAGHDDSRASQSYTLFAAYADAPENFVKLTHAAVKCDGGASEIKMNLVAKNTVALRFEFENGPLGFNVYREIQVIGQAEEHERTKVNLSKP